MTSMTYIIVSACAVVAMFVCFILGYREGLRLGIRAQKGIEPPPIRNPVKVVTDAIEQRENKKKAEEEANIFEMLDSFDGYTDEERKKINGGD